MNISDLLAKASDLLKGEPARVIGYGAAVVALLVANVVGAIPDLTFDQAVTLAVSAVAFVGTVVESIRKFVTPVAKAEAAIAVALATPVPNPDDMVIE